MATVENRLLPDERRAAEPTRLPAATPRTPRGRLAEPVTDKTGARWLRLPDLTPLRGKRKRHSQTTAPEHVRVARARAKLLRIRVQRERERDARTAAARAKLRKLQDKT
jgi:hypothetical protein